MNRAVIALLVVLCLPVLVGCGPSASVQQAALERMVPKGEAEFARNYLARFQAHDIDFVEAKFDPRFKDDLFRTRLSHVADLFPREKPVGIKLVGVRSHTDDTSSQTEIVFEYEYSAKWLLASVRLTQTGEDLVVYGVHLQSEKDSLENTNRFTFTGKGVGHYIVFCAAVLVPIFILVALAICIRTPIRKRKWLWILFILGGLGRLAFDWTTGAYHIDPVNYLLFGAGYLQPSMYSAPVIMVSIPVGAIVFLWKRKQWLSMGRLLNVGSAGPDTGSGQALDLTRPLPPTLISSPPVPHPEPESASGNGIAPSSAEEE